MKTTEINKIIDIKLIDENPQNPRTEIGDVSDLEASIKAHGLIQPITVRPVGKRYQVVAGSRRFTALKNLKFTKIACNIREINDKEAFEIATTENITRMDMDPADECMAVAKMLDDGNDIHTVASHFGRRPRWVIGRAKMARLGGTALEMLKEGTITLGHAEALTLADDKDIERFLGLAAYRSPEELKNIILNERKNLANAKFDTYKICKNCPKQSVKQQDIFGDISESYCLDGECFAKHVAEQVETIRKQFQANGFKECPESEKTSFDYGWGWVNVESEETLDEDRKFKVKWLRANGFKAYYKIDESDASYKFKWNLDEYKNNEEDDEDSGSEQDERELRIKDKAEDLADEEEEGIIKDRLRNLLLVANDDFCAMILDILEERIEIETTGEDGEKETEDDTYLNHVGEGENGLTPKQTVLEKLTDHYKIRYYKNDARNFFGLGDESEYQKRVETNMKKAEKLVDAEDKESNE
jgi:ParB/RepB/Spo0J family partition protein